MGVRDAALIAPLASQFDTRAFHGLTGRMAKTRANETAAKQTSVFNAVSNMEAMGDDNGCKDFEKVEDRLFAKSLFGFTDSDSVTECGKGTALKKQKCSFDADDTHKVVFVNSSSHTLIDYTYKYACLTCGRTFKIKRLKAECHKKRAIDLKMDATRHRKVQLSV